jgi:predicted Zn-dependent protease|tara:strand:- start:783 stop:2279 length:1497 start_codon:yes stop_codon:yes gene_type:complete
MLELYSQFDKKGPAPAMLRLLITLLLTYWCFLAPTNLALAKEIELPLLGDSSSGIVSKQQEYQLGRTWLKVFRSRVTEHDDPLMQLYFEELIYNLAVFSDLENPELELVIIKNPTMNAFAVPGGVVGIHTGLFAFAENEDQMVSVLAHELAHLSQRHFARGLEARRSSSMVTLAGLLAGLVVAATVGGDAGMAAISASQAYAAESQLRYSRSNEQEADRIGLQTMERSGRDPAAAGDMFETLLSKTRYSGTRIPEFLLTHPVTEKRIADARGRSMGSSRRHYIEHPDYYLMQARAIVAMDSSTKISITKFQTELKNNTLRPDAANYGLALAYLNAGEFIKAERLIAALLAEHPRQIAYQYTDIEIDLAQENYATALSKLNGLLALTPNNYPLMALESEILWQDHQYEKSATVLTLLTRNRPEDPMLWYRLAEVRGLAGNISGVHEARAEYFILVGAFDLAREQLGLATKLVTADFKRSAIVSQRLRDVVSMEEKAKRL